MRRRTKGRAIRSTPIFWQCTGHRHRGGEDASNRAIPWWGGRRWRPYRNRRRVACSNETARRVAERPRRRCPFLLVCSRVYGAFIVENPQSIGLNGERNLANASQLQLRLLSFTTTSPPHNGFSSVVYVILLFHIVRSSFFNRDPPREIELHEEFLKGDFLDGFDFSILLSTSFRLVHILLSRRM